MALKLNYLVILCCINSFAFVVCVSQASECLGRVDFQELSTFIRSSSNGTNLPLNIKILNDNRIKRQAYQALSYHGGATEPLNTHPVRKFKMFYPVDFLSIPFMVDIVIFPHSLVEYAKKLLAVGIQRRTDGKILTGFQLETEDLKWQRLDDYFLTNGTRLSHHKIEGGTILVLQEKNEKHSSYCLSIYLLDDNLRLKKLQNIIIGSEISTVVLKSISRDLVMVASYSDSSNYKKYISLYKWRGYHFDFIHSMETRSVILSLSVFNNALIMAVATPSEENGQERTSSQIFVYNEETSQFTLYQNIPTIGSKWVNLFKVNFEYKQDLFALFINNINSQGITVADTMIYKMSKNKFIPFQSIKTKQVSGWHPFQAGKSEFLLISKIADLPLIYQYNGWKFEMVQTNSVNAICDISLTKNIHLGGFSMMMSLDKSNEAKVVVYKPIFLLDKPMENYTNRLENVCIQAKKEINQVNITEEMAEMRYNYNKTQIDYSKFENSVLEILQTKKFTLGNIEIINQTEVKEINDLAGILISQKKIMKKIKSVFSHYVTTDTFKLLKNFAGGHIQIMNTNNIIKKLQLNSLNGISFNSLRDYTFLKNPTQSSTQRFIDNLEVDQILFQKINEVHKDHFINLVNEYLRVNGLVITGNILSTNGLFVGNQINNISFGVNNIILKSGDQELTGSLLNNYLMAITLRTLYLNHMSQREFLNMIEEANLTTTESLSFQILRTKYLSNNGLIGSCNFSNIHDTILHKRGNQEINGLLHLNSVKCNSVENKLEAYNFYSISNFNLIINKEVKFNRAVMANIMIQKYMNDIIIKDGYLNVLLLNTMRPQRLEDYKLFSNIEIMGKIKLSNQATSSLIGEIRAERITNHPISVAGNFVIYGNASVIDEVDVNKDIIHNRKISTIRLLTSGIKISELLVEVPVVIKNHIKFININFDKINSISSKEMLHFFDGDVLSFDRKYFKNVNILGHCNGIKFINEMNLDEFHLNTFLISGDQIIKGNIYINEVYVKSIISNMSTIDGSLVETLIKYEDGFTAPKTLVLHEDMVVQNALKAKNVIIQKHVARFNLSEIIFDTLYSGLQRYYINSNKVFYQPLSIYTLAPRRELLDIKAKWILSALSARKEIYLQKSTQIYNTISAYNIIVKELLDGLHSKEFGKSWLLYEGNQTFTQKQVISAVNVMDDIKITENKINEYDVNSFENILKNTDNIKLKTLKSEGIISNHVIIPNNRINEIDIANILLKDAYSPQTVTKLYNFQYSLLIEKHFVFLKIFESYVQNVKKFLHVTNDCTSKIHIQGKASFHKEPFIKYIGNSNVNEIRQKVWYSSDDVIFKGHDTKFNNMEFMERIYCGGIVNKINLKYMSNEYLSKTRDQSISGESYIHFIRTGSIETQRTDIYETYLTDLECTIEQFIDNIWYINRDMFISANCTQIDVIECDDFHLMKTLNYIDFKTQVFSKDNAIVKVSGFKQFGNLMVHKLVLQPNSEFNGIDVTSWFNNTIQKNTTNQTISDLKQINYIRTPNLRVNK